MFRELYKHIFVVFPFFLKREFRSAVTSYMGRLSPLLSLDELKEKLKPFAKSRMIWDFGESLGVLILPLKFLPDASNPTVTPMS